MTGGIGRGLGAGLFLVAIFTLTAVGTAIGAGSKHISCPLSAGSEDGGCPPFPLLRIAMGGRVAPMTLPRREMRPVAFDLHGRVSTGNGTHPSALREMTISLDRSVSIDSSGMPICRRSIVEERGALPAECSGAIVGGGKADFDIAFPEQPPIREESPVTVYNGGLRDGAQALYVYARADVPVPAAIVSTVEIQRVHQGRYGSQAVIKVPVIAGGSGSLLDFDLHMKRFFELKGVRQSIVQARCPDGGLSMEASQVLFKNEAHTPGVAPTTTMKGLFSIPCTPAD